MTIAERARTLIRFPLDLWEMTVTYLPGPLGFFLRQRFWRGKVKRLGDGVIIDVGVRIVGAEHVTLDDRCWIDRNVIILAGPARGERITYRKELPAFTLGRGEVYVGKQTHVAPNVVISGIGGVWIGMNCGVAAGSMIYSFSHHFGNLTDRSDRHQYSFTPLARSDQQSMIEGPIVMEDYCAVGLNAVLLPGTHMKRGSWVASGAVVIGEIPEQTVLSHKPDVQKKSIADLEIKT